MWEYMNLFLFREWSVFLFSWVCFMNYFSNSLLPSTTTLLTLPVPIPDEEKKLAKFLFSRFFLVPQKVL